MIRAKGVEMELLRKEIRRQFESPATQRFLRLHPALRPETTLPAEFDNLLAQLDKAEQGPNGQGERLG